MLPDILIVHDREGYHLLHGHLHLAVMVRNAAKVPVEVKGLGTVLVSRTADGLIVEAQGCHTPLLAY